MTVTMRSPTTTTTARRQQGVRWWNTFFVPAFFVVGVVVSWLQSKLLLQLTSGDEKTAKVRRYEDEVSVIMPIIDWNGQGPGVPNNQTTKTLETVTTTRTRTTTMTSVLPSLNTNISRILANTNHSRHAYVFVIGGCHPKHLAYRGYVYNILVSTRLLRILGSKADVVAMFMMLQKSKHETLPAEDVRWLHALGVKIKYMPRIALGQREDFYEMQMRKFDILNLTQYSRVLHMDGDVMPVSNLDYLFALSEAGILQENVVVTGPLEPANGGFFMLAPGEGRLQKIHNVIAQRKESDKSIPIENIQKGGNEVFDKVKGWGHVHQPPDQWVTRTGRGQRWTFHAAFADQGLLYHYTKYVQKSVSFIRYNGTISNWGPDPASGAVVELKVLPSELYQYRTSKLLIQDKKSCQKFMCDFIHFTGTQKPWFKGPELEKNWTPFGIWWSTLQQLNQELELGLNFTHWTKLGRPALGTFPKRVG